MKYQMIKKKKKEKWLFIFGNTDMTSVRSMVVTTLVMGGSDFLHFNVKFDSEVIQAKDGIEKCFAFQNVASEN